MGQSHSFSENLEAIILIGALGRQLHPDVETYVACVFDMSEEAPRTHKPGLVFNDKKGLFPLYSQD